MAQRSWHLLKGCEGVSPSGVRIFLADRNALGWMYLVYSWDSKQDDVGMAEGVQGEGGRHEVREL